MSEKRNASFIVLTAEDAIWQGYEGLPPEQEQTRVPLMLMILRWDGCFGFLGGEVEEGETLETAAIREFEEESGTVLTKEESNALRHVSSIETDRITTHLFEIPVSFERMKEVVGGIQSATHYAQEVMGAVIVPAIDYPHKPSFSTFLKGSFAPTVLEQIGDLVSRKNWMLGNMSQKRNGKRNP